MRSERALTAKALAAEAEIAQKTLLQIEKGRRPYGDTLRAVLAVLHAHGPLTESDVFELAEAAGMSAGALHHYLSRQAPLELGSHQVPAPPIEAWRERCHALVDRMLARAEPEDVETALVAMVAAFEASMPAPPHADAPLLTRRGEARQIAPGIIDRAGG